LRPKFSFASLLLFVTVAQLAIFGKYGYIMGMDFTLAMQRAIELARQAESLGEVPIGAVVLSPAGEIVGEGYNQNITLKDPTAHAEAMAIRAACQKLQSRYLTDCTLVVTLEPCVMCAGVASWARVGKVVYGAADPKTGALEQGPKVFTHATTHHKCVVEGGVLADECASLMTNFFKSKR